MRYGLYKAHYWTWTNSWEEFEKHVCMRSVWYICSLCGCVCVCVCEESKGSGWVHVCSVDGRFGVW